LQRPAVDHLILPAPAQRVTFYADSFLLACVKLCGRSFADLVLDLDLALVLDFDRDIFPNTTVQVQVQVGADARMA
jgi:hypothetical protein